MHFSKQFIQTGQWITGAMMESEEVSLESTAEARNMKRDMRCRAIIVM